MTDQTMPRGITVMPGVEQLNDVLRPSGLAAKIYVVDRTAGLYFGRRKPADVETAAQLEGWERDLRNSVDSAAMLLDTARGDMPYITGIRYTDRPQDIPHDQLVQQLLGPGFLEGDNPHEPCLALLSVVDRREVTGIVTPFADAPPLKVVYADMSDPSNPLVVTVDAQALWNRLPAPLELDDDEMLDKMRADLIGRIFQSIELSVKRAGRRYDVNNLWSFTGPGAEDVYHVSRDSKYGKLISQFEWDLYVSTKIVPASAVDAKIGTPVGNDEKEITSLQLRSWVHYLCIDTHDVPMDQAFVLGHDTVTDDRYASARQGQRSGNAMLSVIGAVS